MKTARRIAAGIAVALVAGMSGCGLQLQDETSILRNSCASANDCASGAGQCVTLLTGPACVGVDASLPGLILEVRPGPGAAYGAGTSHLIFDLEEEMEGVKAGGFVVDYTIELRELVKFGPGQIKVDPAIDPPPCQAKAGTIPAKIELQPVSAFVGLPLETYGVSAQLTEDHDHYEFNLAVPPGSYKVYIVPEQIEACLPHPPDQPLEFPPLPPVYLGEQVIDSNLFVNVTVPKTQHLTGTLTIPEMESVDGWTLDMVEPGSGRLISNVQVLEQDAVAFTVPFDLQYYWLFDPSKSPIIRLRPPAEEKNKPRAHWVLAIADLFGTGNVELTLADLKSQAKIISGRARDEDVQPVGATLTFESTRIIGDETSNASYLVTVDTDPEDGSYSVELLQGDYRVIVRPKLDPTKALAVYKDFSIDADDLGGGHDFTIPKKTSLRGRVLTPAGEALGGAIEASPPLPIPAPYFDGVLNLAPIFPDQATGVPASDGVFVLAVDPDNQYDFTFRSLGGSGFPWFVRPLVLVPPTGSDFGALTVPYPAVLQGAIKNPKSVGGVVTEAIIRAWLPVEDPNEPDQQFTGAVIQIAETTSDASGRYVLALPPSIVQ